MASPPNPLDPRLPPSELLALISQARGGEQDIPRSRRIFCGRTMRMDAIELVGFDMDYTLAVYNQAEMEKLSIQLTLTKLVAKRDYPRQILELEYKPELAIRGLAADRQTGNVIKMDRHGHVGRCYHGLRALTADERAAAYRRERVKLSSPRYAWIDTLFALPEAVMYLKLIDFLEARGAVDYDRLWQDVRECIDEAHRDDTLKSVIRADLPRFFRPDPELPATLHKLRSSGKRLFVLTNSLWDYTDAVMTFLLNDKLRGYPSWRNYFDIICVGGGKPAFFTEANPFVELDPQSGKALLAPVKQFQRHHVYHAGNLASFEQLAGVMGDKVLYVGDHIYGDILRAKKSSVWRTCMIVQELEEELAVSERHADRVKAQEELDRKRRNLEAEIDFQQLQLKTLQRVSDDLKDLQRTSLPGEKLPNAAPIEDAKRTAKKALEELRAAHRTAVADVERIEAELEQLFNAFWGPLFKEGTENSRFGEQVQDYACLYTSRVSNLLAYSPLRYFRAPRLYMPHEV